MKIKFIHIIFIIFISLKITAVVYTNYVNGFNISSINPSNISVNSYNFISNDTIFNILKTSKLISDSILVKSINLEKIESKVLEIPYIDKVSSSIDIQSNFSLEIPQFRWNDKNINLISRMNTYKKHCSVVTLITPIAWTFWM